MRRSIEERQERQAAKSCVTVRFPDSSVIWGRSDSRRRVSRPDASLFVTVEPWAQSAPTPAPPSGVPTEALRGSGYIGKAVLRSLSHQKKGFDSGAPRAHRNVRLRAAPRLRAALLPFVIKELENMNSAAAQRR